VDEVGDEGNSTSWACDELSRHRWAVHRHKYQQTTNLQITIWFDYKSSHPAEMENLIYTGADSQQQLHYDIFSEYI